MEPSDVVAALKRPAAYPHRPERIEHVQTHISHVFLAGPFVYKLKKAVHFPFLDCSTIAARRHFCDEEVRLNRRLAPDVYLGVVPVTQAADGAIVIGGSGDPVDWLVHMRRLPHDRTLEALIAAGHVGVDTMAAIARHVAAFHAQAPEVAGADPDQLRALWDENLDGVRSDVGTMIAPETFDILVDFGRTFVGSHEAILRARIGRGRVRDGHGDLRADHVYVIDAAHAAGGIGAGIRIVDCVEFSPAFRAVDVAGDVAFLAMDVTALGRPDLAAALVETYGEAADDPIVPALVPYYACHRATVRGKVEALAAGEAEIPVAQRAAASTRAARAFALAERFAWSAGGPVVVACAGLSGSGKSTVAARLAERTGWRWVSSDVVRRHAPPATGAALYGEAARHVVYRRLRHEVERALAARQSVLVDATFTSRPERDRLARSVRGAGARLVFVECVADPVTIKARLDARDATSVSDARWEVYVKQVTTRQPLCDDEPVLTVDTTDPPPVFEAGLVRRLWDWRCGRPVAREATHGQD